jgi:Rieske Fe-S protein
MNAPSAANDPEIATSGGRSFFGALLAVGGAAVSLVLAIPLVRFSTYPLRRSATETDWSDVGPVEEFASLTAPVAKTIAIEHRDAWQTTSAQTAVYVLPSKDGQFRILSPICPHLGSRPVFRSLPTALSLSFVCFRTAPPDRSTAAHPWHNCPAPGLRWYLLQRADIARSQLDRLPSHTFAPSLSAITQRSCLHSAS